MSTAPEAADMPLEEVGRLVRETLAQAFAGNLEVLDAHPGLACLGQAMPAVLRAFSDWSVELQQLMVDGDRVATNWIARGTHTGPLFGIPPTGRSVRFQSLAIARVQGGRITELNSESGYLGVLRQIGHLPLRPGA